MKFWRGSIAVSAAVVCLATSRQAHAWMIAKDVVVAVSGQTNFELLVANDYTAGVKGGSNSATNAFMNPQLSASLNNGQTTFSWFGSNALTVDLTQHHFGVSGPARDAPQVVDQWWTPIGNNTSGHVPTVGSRVDYPTGTGMASISFFNGSFDPASIATAGFRIVDRTTIRLDQLNQANMPANTFTALPLTVPFVLPRNSSTPTMTIGPINPSTQAVVLFYTVGCYQDACLNPSERSSVNEWVATNDAPPPVPVTGWAFPALVALLSAAGTVRLRAHRHLSATSDPRV